MEKLANVVPLPYICSLGQQKCICTYLPNGYIHVLSATLVQVLCIITFY